MDNYEWELSEALQELLDLIHRDCTRDMTHLLLALVDCGYRQGKSAGFRRGMHEGYKVGK